MQDSSTAFNDGDDQFIDRPEDHPDEPFTEEATSIWQELDDWARNFRPWQKFILYHSVRNSKLTDEQVQQAYLIFLRDNQLADSIPDGIEIPNEITGRPVEPGPEPVRLVALRNLRAINALLPAFQLSFSEGLTVIYGRNGSGKTGAVRVLSNICFSRMLHPILRNIYDEDSAEAVQSADIITNAGPEPITFLLRDAPADTNLKRISVFDSSVARIHLVESGTLDFKPTGFDVFPEMARVYGLLGNYLENDVSLRQRENFFAREFIGVQSEISRLVASLNAETDIGTLRYFGTFGDVENSRLQEVDRQIEELRSQSVESLITGLQEARTHIGALQTNLTRNSQLLTENQRIRYRGQLNEFASKAKLVAETGAQSFKSDKFKGIGTKEWESFLGAAKALAALESVNYPQQTDSCLLCSRPLDEPSIELIRRFWSFLSSAARSELQKANAIIAASVNALRGISFNFFDEGTVVRSLVNQRNPTLAQQTTQYLETLHSDRQKIIDVFTTGSGEIGVATFVDIIPAYNDLLNQIDADIEHLRNQSVRNAVNLLEQERVLLLHKQILNRILPDLESYIADIKWIQSASSIRRNLNTRHLTEKEMQLFSSLITDNYKERLSEECTFLECSLPIEFKTRGDRGQTRKSLSMKGYSPDQVLSEGEQRAIALADFLTEVGLNPANAGIIVDDPVTSQDHDRKEKIAKRLVIEARNRQVIIFTHDLVFLTMLAGAAKELNVEMLSHWIQRDSSGRPGQVSLDDCPDSTPQYRTVEKANKTLTEANAAAGSEQERLLRRGMAELRRTIEEIIPHNLFKQVVNRWTDRVMVTSLKKINWSNELAEELEKAYEELSAFIEGHTHTEERAGAPIEPRHLSDMIGRVNNLIVRIKPERLKQRHS